ncbi:PAS domain-containing protein [Pandoraea pneumonica]|uniref:PAS domain-containing protein n=1 Tax=Pandoraea pneumonica TaxID=2508299 RepID=UPI003CE748FB
MPVEIPAELRQFFDDTPGCWGCKDENSSFLYANAAYGRLIGLDSHLDAVGRTDFDMPGKTVECAAQFQAQDREVVRTRSALRIFDWHPYRDGNWQAHIFTKSPLVSAGGDVVGTIFHGEDLSQFPDCPRLGALLSRRHGDRNRGRLDQQASYLVDTCNATAPTISPRLREVLFFTVRGWSAKMIAQVLGLSSRTVEAHIEALRQAFNVKHRSQLIEAAIAAGQFNVIPASLFNRQLSLILSAA